MLHSFNFKDGEQPEGALVLGNDGNLYGTTTQGGPGYGTVFKITPDGVFTTLYSFTGGADGKIPRGGLIQGYDGYFYGTTSGGGSGYGTIFRFTYAGTLTTLYTFNGNTDGGVLYSGLVQGSDHNFYGTTSQGQYEPYAGGTIFKITTAGAFTTLYSFTEQYPGGESPRAQLVQGSDGNFYGTTYGIVSGGPGQHGTVFKLTPAGAFTNLYTFNDNSDGGYPESALVQGADGNFYGTAGNTVFKITSTGLFTVLRTFSNDTDGSYLSGLLQGSDGNFYGCTQSGGANGYGTVFEITPAGALTTLYSFKGSTDGGAPSTLSALVQGSDGTLYGTTTVGGSGYGTVFSLDVSGR